MNESDTAAGRTGMGRRSFLLTAAAVGAAAPILTEADFAQAKMASQQWGVLPADAVIINANENPLGPCKAALDAIAGIAPLGGRYDRSGIQDKFIAAYAEQQGVKPENVAVYAGSGEPLHYTVLAFTSPTRNWPTIRSSFGVRISPSRVSFAACTVCAVEPAGDANRTTRPTSDPVSGATRKLSRSSSRLTVI